MLARKVDSKRHAMYFQYERKPWMPRCTISAELVSLHSFLDLNIKHGSNKSGRARSRSVRLPIPDFHTWTCRFSRYNPRKSHELAKSQHLQTSSAKVPQHQRPALASHYSRGQHLWKETPSQEAISKVTG